MIKFPNIQFCSISFPVQYSIHIGFYDFEYLVMCIVIENRKWREKFLVNIQLKNIYLYLQFMSLKKNPILSSEFLIFSNDIIILYYTQIML